MAASGTLVGLLGGYMRLLQRRWPLSSRREALSIGAAWAGMTVAFEFGFGHWVAGDSWSALLENYDVTAGKVWALVPLSSRLSRCVVSRRRQEGRADVTGPLTADCERMHERFAVAFRDGSVRAAGTLAVDKHGLLLHGRSPEGELSLEIPFSDISEVWVGRQPTERLNGYATLLLERPGKTTVQIAPLGVALLPEITELLFSLTHPKDGDMLVVVVPLQPGCLDRARELLAKGPPLDPATVGLRSHEVYLSEDEAVFFFTGTDVRAQVSKAIRHPAVWRAGLAWERCFAGAPRIFDAVTPPTFDAEPVYRWSAAP